MSISNLNSKILVMMAALHLTPKVSAMYEESYISAISRDVSTMSISIEMLFSTVRSIEKDIRTLAKIKEQNDEILKYLRENENELFKIRMEKTKKEIELYEEEMKELERCKQEAKREQEENKK